MLTFVAIVHILIALFLILFVLVQDSKGGAMGVFGGSGSSNTLFGSTGATNFLVKATRWTAVAFAATCIYLAYKTSDTGGSVLDDYVPATAPVDSVGKDQNAEGTKGLQEGSSSKEKSPESPAQKKMEKTETPKPTE